MALQVLLLAVLLQANAVVQSTVMRLVGMPAYGFGVSSMPVPMCSAAMGAMAGSTPARPASPMDAAHHDRAICGYCAAAAHAPTLTFVQPVQPSCAVSFPTFLQTAVHGPRGPPSIPPRARGPPLSA